MFDPRRRTSYLRALRRMLNRYRCDWIFIRKTRDEMLSMVGFILWKDGIYAGQVA